MICVSVVTVSHAEPAVDDPAIIAACAPVLHGSHDVLPVPVPEEKLQKKKSAPDASLQNKQSSKNHASKSDKDIAKSSPDVNDGFQEAIHKPRVAKKGINLTISADSTQRVTIKGMSTTELNSKLAAKVFADLGSKLAVDKAQSSPICTERVVKIAVRKGSPANSVSSGTSPSPMTAHAEVIVEPIKIAKDAANQSKQDSNDKNAVGNKTTTPTQIVSESMATAPTQATAENQQLVKEKSTSKKQNKLEADGQKEDLKEVQKPAISSDGLQRNTGEKASRFQNKSQETDKRAAARKEEEKPQIKKGKGDEPKPESKKSKKEKKKASASSAQKQQTSESLTNKTNSTGQDYNTPDVRPKQPAAVTPQSKNATLVTETGEWLLLDDNINYM